MQFEMLYNVYNTTFYLYKLLQHSLAECISRAEVPRASTDLLDGFK